MVGDKTNILTQDDVHTGKALMQHHKTRLSIRTLNTTVKKNGEANERSYVQYRTSSNQQKLTKYSPLYEYESIVAAWYKQGHANNASKDVNTIGKKALQITAHLGADYFTDSNG